MIAPITPQKPTPLAQAAKQLEAVFLRQMIAAMRAPALGEDHSASQFRDMSDAKLAENMAGKFGIAEMVEKQMKGFVP
ncbi:MAG: flagellar biosynthesis protein FlgI [Novosphingobium sp.]|nr:flagellar biosynthesis protein FlgI [Novosphingobium sp.]